MADVAKPANQMNSAWKDLTQTAAGLSKQFGIVERQMSKFKVAMSNTTAGTIYYVTRGVMQQVRAMASLFEKESDAIKAKQNMTIAQKVGAATLFRYNGVLALSSFLHEQLAVRMTKNNQHQMRFIMLLLRGSTYMFFTVTALAALGVAFLAFDANVNGASSSIFDINTRFETLNASLAGLGTLLTGEGGAGGLAMLGGALLATILVAALFGATLGKITLALGLIGTLFRTVQEATGSVGAAIMSVTGVVAGFILTAANLVGPKSSLFRFGVLLEKMAIKAGVATSAMTAGVVLIIAGIAGLVAIATGHADAITYVLTTLALIVGGIFTGLAATIGLPFVIAGSLIAVFVADAINLGDQFFVVWAERAASLKDAIWEPIAAGIAIAVPLLAALFSPLIQAGDVAFTSVNAIVAGIIGSITAAIDSITTAWSAFKNSLTFDLDFDLGFLGNIDFGGFMAKGGSVSGGKSYIVGEQGPELFTPGSSGNITPNDQLGGGGNITLNINVGGVTDRTDKRALAREIGDMLTQELRRTGGAPTRGRF
tara:strand:+ start:147 stop:1769 length:1623 start_codon:yes stop_codon:yes gene_type:complete